MGYFLAVCHGEGMLQKLGQEDRLCQERAQECAAAAKAALTDDIPGQYLGLEKSWLTLPRSYQFAQRLGAFVDDGKKRRAEFKLRLLEKEKPKSPSYQDRDWQALSCAPFDCNLELAVIDSNGAHALVFPMSPHSRRMDQGANQTADRGLSHALAKVAGWFLSALSLLHVVFAHRSKLGFFLGQQTPKRLPPGFVLLLNQLLSIVLDVETCHELLHAACLSLTIIAPETNRH